MYATIDKRRRALAALTDSRGNPFSWLTSEEIGYSPFLKDFTPRQIVAALQGLRRMGIVEHKGSEWRLTVFGLEKTRTGI